MNSQDGPSSVPADIDDCLQDDLPLCQVKLEWFVLHCGAGRLGEENIRLGDSGPKVIIVFRDDPLLAG